MELTYVTINMKGHRIMSVLPRLGTGVLAAAVLASVSVPALASTPVPPPEPPAAEQPAQPDNGNKPEKEAAKYGLKVSPKEVTPGDFVKKDKGVTLVVTGLKPNEKFRYSVSKKDGGEVESLFKEVQANKDGVWSYTVYGQEGSNGLSGFLGTYNVTVKSEEGVLTDSFKVTNTPGKNDDPKPGEKPGDDQGKDTPAHPIAESENFALTAQAASTLGWYAVDENADITSTDEAGHSKQFVGWGADGQNNPTQLADVTIKKPVEKFDYTVSAELFNAETKKPTGVKTSSEHLTTDKNVDASEKEHRTNAVVVDPNNPGKARFVVSYNSEDTMKLRGTSVYSVLTVTDNVSGEKFTIGETPSKETTLHIADVATKVSTQSIPISGGEFTTETTLKNVNPGEKKLSMYETFAVTDDKGVVLGALSLKDNNPHDVDVKVSANKDGSTTTDAIKTTRKLNSADFDKLRKGLDRDDIVGLKLVPLDSFSRHIDLKDAKAPEKGAPVEEEAPAEDRGPSKDAPEAEIPENNGPNTPDTEGVTPESPGETEGDEKVNPEDVAPADVKPASAAAAAKPVATTDKGTPKAEEEAPAEDGGPAEKPAEEAPKANKPAEEAQPGEKPGTEEEAKKPTMSPYISYPEMKKEDKVNLADVIGKDAFNATAITIGAPAATQPDPEDPANGGDAKPGGDVDEALPEKPLPEKPSVQTGGDVQTPVALGLFAVIGAAVTASVLGVRRLVTSRNKR